MAPRLPEVKLDDRGFQELVSEARSRIARTCPEWSEHNVSDPGITLIELFAQMVDQLIYRVNRIPEKLHVALLELLGIRLDPPSAAHTSVRFRLTSEPDEPVPIPAGETEVGTLRTASQQSVIFQTTEDFTIQPLKPAAYVLKHGGTIMPVAVADGTARPHGEQQAVFGSPPAPGDALHLGFDAPIARLLLRIDVEAPEARGAGVDPRDPPLRWEVSAGDNTWLPAEVLVDNTGGFNYGSGSVELQLPEHSGPELLSGKRLHWVRCRVDVTTSSGKEASYTHAPRILSITAAPVGALLPASHRARSDTEFLGVSDGTPAQVFELRMGPILPLGPGETLEVQQPGSEDWETWTWRESFASSSNTDKHFSVDLVAGRIELGPAIRETDGAWTQYGAVPPKGAMLRLTGYHHGGGRHGNVAANTLTTLKSARAGISTVTNPKPAVGGVDAESLAGARERAAMEIRSRYRAVTAEDYEFLAGEASPRVGRALCLPPRDGGAVSLHLLPVVDPADAQIPYDQLMPDEELFATVAAYLDERRTIGTTVQLLPVKLRGVSVVVDVQIAPTAHMERVKQDVAHALYVYLNPLIGGSVHGRGTGWPFGRPLNQGELYGVVHAIEGVEYVKILRVYETNLETKAEDPQQAGPRIILEPDELLASGVHRVKATRREL
jgi:predicted phage baseplate assembly protein